MTTKEMMAVMAAFDRGEKIQGRTRGSALWMDAPTPSWAWNNSDYRAEPQTVEFWINEYPGKSYRLHATLKEAELFSQAGRVRLIHVQEVA